MKRLITALKMIGWQKRRAEFFSIALAFSVSLVSLLFSWQANRQAYVQARPYVSLDVVPAENGHYLTAICDGTNYILTYKIVFNNYGQTPAVNITLPEAVVTGRDGKQKPISSPVRERPHPAALAAGAGYSWMAAYIIPIRDNDPQTVKKVNSGQLGMDFRVAVNYEGIGMKGAEYYTYLSCEVYSDRRVLKSTSFK